MITQKDIERFIEQNNIVVGSTSELRFIQLIQIDKWMKQDPTLTFDDCLDILAEQETRESLRN